MTAVTTTQPQSADELAIRTLYQRMLDGWNQGSAAAFAAPLTDDADFVAFDGSYFKGREAIVASHQPLFEKYLKGSRLVGEVMSVRLLSSSVALMHARGATIMRGASQAAPERDSIQTLVAVKENATWMLTAFQNTRVRPIGRNLGGTLVWLLGDWLWRLARPRQ
jgi:uncharacterized protein (TIGR02246 family)